MHDLASLFSPAMIENPYPLYAELRKSAPVFKLDPVGFWLISRYDDAQYVLRTPELFSSSRTMAVRTAIRDTRLRESMESFSGASLIDSDAPDHTRLRRLINAAFTPRAIARLEPRIRSLSRELVANVLRKGEFDLMADIAVPLPVIVISEMLGVDPSRRADFKRWSDDLVAASTFGEPLEDREIDRLIRSRLDLVAYFQEMIDLRRREPRQDLISDLVRAEVEHEVLSPDEVLSLTILLMVAGNETTTNLIGNATAEILNHPDDLRRLRENTALVPGFIEEALRYRSPVTIILRSTTEDVTLRGVTIPEDATVAVLVDSANHDPAQFSDPERFDITRHPPAHLSFGYGVHFCVGAPLSRLEAKIVFEEMFRRLPPFSRKPGALDWAKSFSLRGLRTLPLSF